MLTLETTNLDVEALIVQSSDSSLVNMRELAQNNEKVYKFENGVLVHRSDDCLGDVKLWVVIGGIMCYG